MSMLKRSVPLAGASLLVIAVLSSTLTMHSPSSAATAQPRKGFGKPPAKKSAPRTTQPVSSPSGGLTPDEKVNVSVYEKCHRAVVNIAPLATAEQVYFYGHDSQEGIGSGVVISSEGHIVTNNHVIGNTQAVKVTFFDGTSLPARVIGVDPSNDLAVLKISDETGKKFDFAEWGDSSNLKPGRRVFAIGNPFGFDHTMTSGIVSSLNRTISTPNKRIIKGVIQTDAAINPGNSGGPLLDAAGRIIGITTAIMSLTRQSAGIGLAIPSNTARAIVPELVAHGVVRRPEIGITVLHPEGVRLKNGVLVGLRIIQLDPKGPAVEAGLKTPKVVRYNLGNGMVFQGVDRNLADLITAVDNIEVGQVDDLYSYIEKKQAGQVVNLTVLRNDPQKGPRIIKIPVKLAVTRND